MKFLYNFLIVLSLFGVGSSYTFINLINRYPTLLDSFHVHISDSENRAPFDKQNKKKKILDIGCGEGTSTNFVAQKFGKNAATIVGVDKNELSVMKASHKYPSLHFGIDDMRRSRLPTNEFDIIFVKDVFHEVDPKDFSKIIKNIKRISKKENSLIYMYHEKINDQFQDNMLDFYKHFDVIYTVSEEGFHGSIAKL